MKISSKAMAILLFAGFSASAQTLLVNHSDSVAGSRIIQTDNQIGPQLDMDDSVARRGAIFFSAGYQSSTVAGKVVETYFIDLNIVHNDNRLGCLEEKTSHITLLLEDGTSINCFQISDTDCDKAAYHAAFALMPKDGSPAVMKQNFEKLMSVGISEIHVTTTEGELDYKIKKDFKPYLQKHFALIDKTVKGGTQNSK